MLSVIAALLPFAVSTAITPGPNNVMLTASGATFGFRRTVPHMAGILNGFPAMLVAIGWGLGSDFEAYPLAHAILCWVGSAYLPFLAWKMATAGRAGAGNVRGRPLSFLQSAAFKWVSPKSWMMAVGAVTAFTPSAATSILRRW